MAASRTRRCSVASAAASGDGAASPEGRSSATRSARSSWRRPLRRRLRASLATIASSQGRNGAPARNLGRAPRDHVRRPEGEVLVPPDQRLVGTRITLSCPLDELLFVQWSALHGLGLVPSYTGARRRVPPIR